MARGAPTAANTKSAPASVVSATTRSSSSPRASTACVAPKRRATSSFSGAVSAAITTHGPGARGGLHDVEPDAAGADHDDPVAGRDARAVLDGPDAGHDRAGDDRRGGEADALAAPPRPATRGRRPPRRTRRSGCPAVRAGRRRGGSGSSRRAGRWRCTGSARRRGSGRTSPQWRTRLTTTRSPGRTPSTPGPTSSTTPAASCPSTTGTSPPHAPFRAAMSLWQTAHARTATRTSSCCGGSSATSSTESGSP